MASGRPPAPAAAPLRPRPGALDAVTQPLPPVAPGGTAPDRLAGAAPDAASSAAPDAARGAAPGAASDGARGAAPGAASDGARGAAPEVLVRLEGVTRSFPGATTVLALRDVDMVVRRGDYVSIMGPSGSGKSTLLNVLGLLDRPTVGRYELDGVDTAPLRDRDRTRLRGRRLGFVFQAFHLLARRTVLENVVLGMAYGGVPRAERRERAWRALERVSMTHRALFFPTTLSGGERQRVAIARAVAGSPALLLADEPTGNLDAATSADVLGVLEELNRSGLAVAVVTHDPEVSAAARRRFTMRDGRLREEP